MSSYTIDFSAYSLTEGGDEGTVNLHNLSTIFQGDYKFEDVSTVDTGGLTGWGQKIEAISTDDSNWTIVRLSHTGGNLFSLDDFDYRAEGAHTYKLVNPDGVEYEVSTANDDMSGGGNDVNSSTLDNSFSNVAYVDFYSRAITYTNMMGNERTQTKWHLDDIQVTAASNSTISDRDSLDTAITAWIADEDSATTTYGDISDWNVSAITDFSNLFEDSDTFNSDISGWDVSSGTDFSYMFDGASAFNQNLSLWDVSSGTTFTDMFNAAASMSNSQGINSTPNTSYFDATTGNDIITGTPGFNNSLRGHNGNDRLSGLAGNDSIFGDSGNDRLFGKGGIDALNGGEGHDKLIGGSGRDTAIFGAGNNRIDLSITDRQNTREGRDLFSSIENVKGGDGNDYIYGDGVINYLYGENNNDRLYGRDGNDRLYGEAGNDRLFGEAGNDILLGGEGNDFLTGGLGNDQLTGGAGRDKFCISTGTGRDVITDYGNGNDRISLLGGLTESDLTIREFGTDVRIKYDGDLIAIVQDTLISDLTFI